MTAPVRIPVRQRTPEWLAARLDGIGASEAAAAIGLSRYESPMGLWARKLGYLPPQEETLAMAMGTALEPLIAERYTRQVGLRVRRSPMLLRHGDIPFLLASLDRRAGQKLVELKYSERATDYGDPGTDEVPDEVLCQAIQQMAVADVDAVDVVLLRAGAPDVAIYPIVRHRVAEARQIEREREFWRCVETRTEPPLDDSEATRRAVFAMHPEDDGTWLDPTPELVELVLSLAGARAAKATAEKAEGEARTRLRGLLGNASGITGLLSAKKNRDSERTDWPSVAKDYRRLLEGKVPANELDVLVSIHTETAQGDRPLRLLSKEIA